MTSVPFKLSVSIYFLKSVFFSNMVRLVSSILPLIFISFQVTKGEIDNSTSIGHLNCTEELRATNKKIHQFLQHLADGKKGLPDVVIENPMNISNFNVSPNDNTEAQFRNARIYGVSDFILSWINLDLVQLQLQLGLEFNKLSVVGDYSLKSTSFYIRISGEGLFYMNITEPKIFCNASMNFSDSGQLQLSQVDVDITIEEMRLHFENLAGQMSGLTNSIVNAMRRVIFQSVKPKMETQLQEIIFNQVNTALSKFPRQPFFLSPLFPVDFVLDQLCEQMKEDGMDPRKLPDHVFRFEQSLFLVTVKGSFKLHDGYVKGLSTLHRTRDIGASLRNGSLLLIANFGFDQLESGFSWSTRLFGVFHTGGVFVHVDSVVLNVSLGVFNNSAFVEDFSIEDIGQITIDFDGLGSLDALIEYFSNAVANFFKSQISEVIEDRVVKLLDEKLKNLEELYDCK